MYASGYSLRHIGIEFGISQETVRQRLMKIGMERRRKRWRQERDKSSRCPRCGVLSERGVVCDWCVLEEEEEVANDYVQEDC